LEVMATLLPIKALTRVDLPALGRPMKVTKPEKNSWGVPAGAGAGCWLP